MRLKSDPVIWAIINADGEITHTYDGTPKIFEFNPTIYNSAIGEKIVCFERVISANDISVADKLKQYDVVIAEHIVKTGGDKIQQMIMGALVDTRSKELSRVVHDLLDPLPCGHPQYCLESLDDESTYCTMCAEIKEAVKKATNAK